MFLMPEAEYRQLTQDAQELEQDLFGPKVYLLPDRRIIKLFRIKRLLSLSAIYPYSLRFARNARRLNAMGIVAPHVTRQFFCVAIRRHGIIYPLLKGEPLAKLLSGDDGGLVEQFAGFIARLHQQGVYFRSLHLGNVLLLPNGDFGLIDVADLRLRSFPLGMAARRRNFRHLFRLPEHRAVFERFGMGRFLECYCQAAGIPSHKSGELLAS
jgi:tRNA A-37 threonylcarbamoyl transferase component Bud32